MSSRVELVERIEGGLSILDQCKLLGIPRSSYYYEPCREDAVNIMLMRLIDEIYTIRPYYGSRRIAWELNKKGYAVGRDLVVTLMRRMGVQAIYAKPRLSDPHPNHKVYPYLLRNLTIDEKDLVWSMDITYIRMKHGFLYLTAIIDWYTRYILSWKLANSLDVGFCIEALVEALAIGKPLIFNTDQGSQFTSLEFTGILEQRGIKISMDGRGRALDNIFIERFWRSLKQEEVYLKDYQDGIEAYEGIEKYFTFYNEERPHMALNYKAPGLVYTGGGIMNVEEKKKVTDNRDANKLAETLQFSEGFGELSKN
jgi:putative transposase